MATTKKHNFVKGSAKEVTFSNGGRAINVSLNIDSLLALTKSDKGYVYITLATLPEPDKYGNTWTIYEDDYRASKLSATPAEAPLRPTTGANSYPKAEKGFGQYNAAPNQDGQRVVDPFLK